MKPDSTRSPKKIAVSDGDFKASSQKNNAIKKIPEIITQVSFLIENFI